MTRLDLMNKYTEKIQQVKSKTAIRVLLGHFMIDVLELEQTEVNKFDLGDVSKSVCRTFISKMDNTSATICSVCGKEKYLH